MTHFLSLLLLRIHHKKTNQSRQQAAGNRLFTSRLKQCNDGDISVISNRTNARTKERASERAKELNEDLSKKATPKCAFQGDYDYDNGDDDDDDGAFAAMNLGELTQACIGLDWSHSYAAPQRAL